MKAGKYDPNSQAPAAPYGSIPAMPYTGTTDHPDWQRFVCEGIQALGNEIVRQHGPETYRCFLYQLAGVIRHGDENDLGWGADVLFEQYAQPYYDSVFRELRGKHKPAAKPAPKVRPFRVMPGGKDAGGVR